MIKQRRMAQGAALLILILGLLAIVAPGRFAGIVAMMQEPPRLYLAALLRLTIGTALLLGAGSSRAKLAVYFIGGVIALGGLVTPMIGQGIARPILDAWQQGGDVIVRAWGAAATGLGAFLLWALVPKTTPTGT
jgi:hypothetical protein